MRSKTKLPHGYLRNTLKEAKIGDTYIVQPRHRVEKLTELANKYHKGEFSIKFKRMNTATDEMYLVEIVPYGLFRRK